MLELCELSSILQFNIIESEAEAAGIPARQTTNRYWGISPQGGDSEEDVYAWHYFMDLDRTWATSRADLIQPHFDEVSAFGYGNTIQAAKDMIQDSLETSETANAA